MRFLLTSLLLCPALVSAETPADKPIPQKVEDSGLRAGVRLKELVSIEGVRSNQLIGYGLVVGLNGTGDRRQTVFSAQTLTNILQHMGVNVPPAAIQVKNTAAVMVTATLPPFAQPGSTIDATA